MSDAKKIDFFDLSAGVPGIEGSLRPKPKFADRISKRVIFVAILFVLLMVVIFLVSLDNMDAKNKTRADEKNFAKKTASKASIGAKVPQEFLAGGMSEDSLNKESKKAPLVPASLVKPQVVVVQEPVEIGNKASSVKVPKLKGVSPTSEIPKETADSTGATHPSLTPEQQAVDQAKRERVVRMSNARSNGLSAKSFDGQSVEGANGVVADTSGKNTSQAMAAILAASKNVGVAGALQNPAKLESEQEEKLEFLKAAQKEVHGYHPHVALPALSENEVKNGSFIALALEQSINSDMPGQITARVIEPVFDTITGCNLLIPPMSKAVGRYDSKVALGQGRMLVVWNSLIFPDGAELNLAGMQGYDSNGQAGLKSDVDNHYLRLFGVAFGMSMITAGVQLSVPQPATGPNGAVAPQTTGQTIGTALVQQYGQLGAQIIGKYMAVQPTLQNYSGEKFLIMVPQTMLFKKVWRKRC